MSEAVFGILLGLSLGCVVLFGWWMAYLDGKERGERDQFWAEREGGEQS